MRKYSIQTIIGTGLFIIFIVGIASMLIGLIALIASMFLFSSDGGLLGIFLLFVGMAIAFVSAGLGCLLLQEDWMLKP